MKRIIFILLCAVFMLSLPFTAYAANNDGDGVTITVVIPNAEKPAATPAPTPQRNYLYPVSVWESVENGRREIIRTYELAPYEKPEDISRESFMRDSFLYELADITRKETANADVRDHTEKVSIDTQTNDMAAILNLLASTLEYTSEDGYIGILTLDIASIKVEQAGTRSSSYTVSATREYLNLSNNDTSLIPKTITDNGRTLTLDSVNWQTQNYVTVDYDRIPETYKAVATYTGTASRTTVTGYITTAEYKGVVSKILTGRTVYTAYFIGVPIVTGTVNRPETTAAPETTLTPEPTQAPTETSAEPITEPTITESTTETPPPSETEEPTETIPPTETAPPSETEAESEEKPFNKLPLVFIASLLAGTGIGGCFVYMYLLKNRKPKEEISDEIKEDEEDID